MNFNIETDIQIFADFFKKRPEVLPDQFGADDLAVTDDQAALGLVRKYQLGNAGHRKRVGETGEDGHRQDHDDGRTDVLGHGWLVRVGA
jgi:hypothetical protein